MAGDAGVMPNFFSGGGRVRATYRGVKTEENLAWSIALASNRMLSRLAWTFCEWQFLNGSFPK